MKRQVFRTNHHCCGHFMETPNLPQLPLMLNVNKRAVISDYKFWLPWHSNLMSQILTFTWWKTVQKFHILHTIFLTTFSSNYVSAPLPLPYRFREFCVVYKPTESETIFPIDKRHNCWHTWFRRLVVVDASRQIMFCGLHYAIHIFFIIICLKK